MREIWLLDAGTVIIKSIKMYELNQLIITYVQCVKCLQILHVKKDSGTMKEND